jgi:hypothetical protein
MNSACKDCRYSRPHFVQSQLVAAPGATVASKKELQCWRFPPVPVGGATPQGLMLGTGVPVVQVTDYCGEFAPKSSAGN